MPVTNVTTDPDSRSLTITAEFAAPPERVFAIYADPRQVEKVFGPPATRPPSSTTTSASAARSPTT